MKLTLLPFKKIQVSFVSRKQMKVLYSKKLQIIEFKCP
jgi:hypothetical protein